MFLLKILSFLDVHASSTVISTYSGEMLMSAARSSSSSKSACMIKVFRQCCHGNCCLKKLILSHAYNITRYIIIELYHPVRGGFKPCKCHTSIGTLHEIYMKSTRVTLQGLSACDACLKYLSHGHCVSMANIPPACILAMR